MTRSRQPANVQAGVNSKVREKIDQRKPKNTDTNPKPNQLNTNETNAKIDTGYGDVSEKAELILLRETRRSFVQYHV